MPKKRVTKAIAMLPKNVKKANIAILGLGFRGEVTDVRLSLTYAVVKEFLKKGHDIAVHDPYITEDKNLPSEVILSSDLSLVTKNSNLIFISSDHKYYSQLNYSSFRKAKKPILIFDGRNILNPDNFKKSYLMTIGIR